MSRTLLIDADLMAYRASAGNQDVIDWNGDGEAVIDARLEDAQQAIENDIDWLMAELKGTDLIICLSDEVSNFRKTIDPTYKSNRSGVERPVLLYDLKEWMAERWPSRTIPTLEADDVMGILATEPHKGQRIIVSNDKDMRTVPSVLAIPPMTSDQSLRVLSITERCAVRYHYGQTITGDVVDGYPGCPGAGPGAAERVLDKGRWFERRERVLKSGPNKGTTRVEWVANDDHAVPAWQRIVSLYEAKGLTEAHAVRQARLAFILQSSHFVDGKRLDWHPPKTGEIRAFH